MNQRTRYCVTVVVLAFASGMTMACTAQMPFQPAIDASALTLPSYGSHGYYEAPASIAASVRLTKAGLTDRQEDKAQKASGHQSTSLQNRTGRI